MKLIKRFIIERRGLFLQKKVFAKFPSQKAFEKKVEELETLLEQFPLSKNDNNLIILNIRQSINKLIKENY